MKRRIALIPGGVRGIGRAVALRLADCGWSSVLAYRESLADAEATSQALEAMGAPALAVRTDVSNPDECRDLVARTLAWNGRIDALVHTAGPYRRIGVLDETHEGWRATFRDNLDAFFFMARAVIPHMKERGGGRIVAFATANADRLVAQPHLAAYYLAKVGVLGLVRTLARELAPLGITVNAVSPAFIDTGAYDSAEREALVAKIPAGRLGTPAEAASAVAYLLSDEASYVTGANLSVTGGWGL